MQTPQPQPQSKCPFCGKPHPPKEMCRERREALAEAKRMSTRPYRAGKFRGERNR